MTSLVFTECTLMTPKWRSQLKSLIIIISLIVKMGLVLTESIVITVQDFTAH